MIQFSSALFKVTRQPNGLVYEVRPQWLDTNTVTKAKRHFSTLLPNTEQRCLLHLPESEQPACDQFFIFGDPKPALIMKHQADQFPEPQRQRSFAREALASFQGVLRFVQTGHLPRNNAADKAAGKALLAIYRQEELSALCDKVVALRKQLAGQT